MKALQMKKKGQLGSLVELPGKVVIGLLILAVTVIAVFLALGVLTTSNIFTANSTSYNNTIYIANNITGGATSFFNYVPTVFTVLGVVLILGAIGLLIFVVYRFARGSEGGI